MIKSYRILDWDSNFFNLKIARLEAAGLTKEDIGTVDRRCRADEIQCLYFLCSADDQDSIDMTAGAGYQAAAIRLEFEHSKIEPLPVDFGVDICRCSPLDAESLRALASGSFKDSRFYRDKNFHAEQGDCLFDAWITRSLESPKCAVFGSYHRSKLNGFVTCDFEEEGRGRIGLLAVAKDARGKGVGQSLVSYAVRYFHGLKIRDIRVTTQGSNISAQRLYQRQGFLTLATDIWYHRWFGQMNV